MVKPFVRFVQLALTAELGVESVGYDGYEVAIIKPNLMYVV